MYRCGLDVGQCQCVRMRSIDDQGPIARGCCGQHLSLLNCPVHRHALRPFTSLPNSQQADRFQRRNGLSDGGKGDQTNAGAGRDQHSAPGDSRCDRWRQWPSVAVRFGGFIPGDLGKHIALGDLGLQPIDDVGQLYSDVNKTEPTTT